MKYVVDAHAHTIMSGHGYSTLKEMISAGKNTGLELLCITEHAPAMPGTCNALYFMNYRIINRQAFEIPILLGVELNILDTKGTVDLSNDILETLDIRIASIHPPCFDFSSKKDCTQATIRALENPNIDMIGHPDDERFPLDYEAVVKTARDYKKILEVNNASLLPTSYRPNAIANYKQMLRFCEMYGVSICINSDAHIDYLVGGHTAAQELLQSISFPEELILNTSTIKFKNALQKIT